MVVPNQIITAKVQQLNAFLKKNYRMVIPGIIILMVIGIVIIVSSQAIYAVQVNGETVGYVDDVAALKKNIDDAMVKQSELMEQEVAPAQEIEYVRVSGDDIEICSVEEVTDKLFSCVTLQTIGAVIVIDGVDVVGLSNEEEAQAVIAAIKDEYMNTYGRLSSEFEEVTIQESVEIIEKEIPVNLFMNPDEAKSYIRNGTTELREYVVAKGDSLWTISRANKISLEELKEANPQISGTTLSIGQKVKLTVANPYINIISKEKMTETVKVAYKEEVKRDSSLWNWERRVVTRGESGSKRVVYEVTRRNGSIVEKKVISETVLKAPIAQVIVKGTKTDTSALIVGTGRFLWPVQGKITSPYGYRSGGFHTGVDIAAPYKTPIRAADDGTVKVAAYSSTGYGNRVELNHGNGFSTLYAHCSSFNVRVGQVVRKGDIIAYVGSTGRSSGNHCHFEIRVNGQHVNPMKYY